MHLTNFLYINFKNKCFSKSGQHGKTAANVIFRIYWCDSTQPSPSWITRAWIAGCKQVGRERRGRMCMQEFFPWYILLIGDGEYAVVVDCKCANLNWVVFFFGFLLTSFCRLKERCKQDLLGLMNRGPALSHWLLVHTRCIQHSLGMQN